QGLLPLDYSNVESVVLTGGTVVVSGTEGNDVITIDAAGIVTVADKSGQVVQTYNLSGVNAVVVDALGGDDAVSISSSGLLAGGDTNNNDGATIDVTAAGGPATLRYTPLSNSTARLERVEGGPVLNVTGFNNVDNAFSLAGGGNIKALQVVGPAGNDLVQVT